jgi:hypothetical protein
MSSKIDKRKKRDINSEEIQDFSQSLFQLKENIIHYVNKELLQDSDDYFHYYHQENNR